ncbi:Csu type fimbrial protein [Rhodalgimonas zhirmunskyi]|uniref:Spore coat U domain-containing protein n=1 Tax=Rhodalgimonas zhirmunskyi TaxID=2964767 RepID=A0AAJ1X432_9RHOB|nr:spore coat U domain-containing protein [Rhodoalgimonas zhirmunskyi]MDQ2092704.1 spore coat U domain-containing protein [Rhodoalgimonas zhirmunskyi]
MLTHFKPLAGALALALAAGSSAQAAEETGNLGVLAVVADTCILATGTALSFATINTTTTSNQVTPGLVTVTCTASRASVDVKIGAGDNASGGTRQMKSTAGDFLPYSIYSDSGHASEIAIDGTLYDEGITAAVPTVLPVYGQIPAGSYNAGAYSDTLLVTLSY